MIYGDFWINSLAFASLCRWLLCQDTHGPGSCARVSLQYGPKITGCLNVLVFSPPTSAEGEKPSYQHCSRICKHSSLGKIWGLQKLGVVINYLVMKVIILVKTAPILAWAESRSLPIFPWNALSHLIRWWSGCGWLRGKRLQSHRMNISKLLHKCSYRCVFTSGWREGEQNATDVKTDVWSQSHKMKFWIIFKSDVNLNKPRLKIIFCSFSDPINNSSGQSTSVYTASFKHWLLCLTHMQPESICKPYPQTHLRLYCT